MQQQHKDNYFVFIIPAYNGVKWIYRVLDSIKVQKYSKYRIIYINDCSSDNTLQVLEKYKNENNWMNISVITKSRKIMACLFKICGL